MVNNIIAGITQKLAEISPGCSICLEKKPQDINNPYFLISLLLSTQKLIVQNRYWRTHQFDIRYYPADKDNAVKECNEIASALFMGLEYITADNDLIRGEKMNYNIQNDVLHFFIDYNVFICKIPEKQPRMNSLKQTQHLKGDTINDN